MENPDGCANPGYLAMDPTHANFKELYATLMAAYVAGKTVQLHYGGCNSGGHPLVISIAVPNIW